MSAEADVVRNVLRSSWQFKIEQHTKGNETMMGMIVLAVLRRRPHNPPAIGPKAIILAGQDGNPDAVFADALHKDGSYHKMQLICTVQELTDNFRRLADQLKLSDEDRKAMFAEVKKWIVKDLRAVSDVNLWDDKKMKGASQ